MSSHQPPSRRIDLREHAIDLMHQAASTAGMSRAEAEVVVEAMKPLHLLADTLLFEEGDATDNDYMVLVLEGQLRAVSSAGIPDGEVVITVVGPGSLLGEMGVIDGGPRSTSCTALTDVKLGVLSREAMMGLIEQHPTVGARLALGVARIISGRLREGNRRLRTLSQVSRALQLELDAVHSVNRRLLEEQVGRAG
jgi:CRP/FNR family transcriptional regulator, cyclic AMP receptor protein